MFWQQVIVTLSQPQPEPVHEDPAVFFRKAVSFENVGIAVTVIFVGWLLGKIAFAIKAFVEKVYAYRRDESLAENHRKLVKEMEYVRIDQDKQLIEAEKRRQEDVWEYEALLKAAQDKLKIYEEGGNPYR